MEIEEIKSNKEQYMEVLLLADEEVNMINRYLNKGIMYRILDPNLRAVCIITMESDEIIEIKNIAVLPEYRKMGYGKSMITYIINKYKNDYCLLQVGTGESDLTVPFYEKCGFTYSHRINNFFIDNYSHPIFECGNQLVDMVYYKMNLHVSRETFEKLYIIANENM
ncbi:MAG: GNAT family N-acetyltransferase [Lachnospiraceae bacterium]|nr:GNAT family N-acetyltransferase [Lachnospiraceae bacterium]